MMSTGYPDDGTDAAPGAGQGSGTALLIGVVIGVLLVGVAALFVLWPRESPQEAAPPPTPVTPPDPDTGTAEPPTATDSPSPAPTGEATDEAPPSPTVEEGAEAASPSPTGEEEAAATDPADEEERTAGPDAEGECEPPAPGAYPCAGGPVLDDATEVASVIESAYGGVDTAVLVSPSGNIGCDIYTSSGSQPATMGCLVLSWGADGPPVEPEDAAGNIGVPILMFGDGSEPPRYGGAKADPFCFMEGACDADSEDPVQAQVVEYGQVVHYAGFVCASERNGMTCWHEDTGHGAVFAREVFESF